MSMPLSIFILLINMSYYHMYAMLTLPPSLSPFYKYLSKLNCQRESVMELEWRSPKPPVPW